jgi:hypothetical protein
LTTDKLNELKTVIEEQHPLIIGITEVFPKNQSNMVDMDKLLMIENYELYRRVEGTTERRDRGTYLYIHNTLESTTCDSLMDHDFQESVWCNIKLEKNCKMLVGCVYRSPTTSDENNEKLLQLMRAASEVKADYLVVMGDFNWKEIDWNTMTAKAGDEHITHKFIECIRDCFIHQHVDFPTRYREGNIPSTLDLVFTNEEQLISNITPLSPLGKSDHVVLNIDLDLRHNFDISVKEAYKHMYEKADYRKLSEILQSIDWEEEIQGRDLNSAWEFFEEEVQKAIDTCIPKRKFIAGRKFKPLWMNAKALSAVKKKYKSWCRYTNTKQYGDYKEYCSARNKATTEVKRAKRDFEKQIAKEVKKNPKTFWKYVNSKMKTTTRVSDLEQEDGTLTTSDQEKANVLNGFFSSVFTDENKENIPEMEKKYVGPDQENIEVTKEEILKKIDKLKPTKAPGPDGLHPRVLKELRNTIVSPLYEIFVKSVKEGEVPAAWKKAHVTAIFKKGKKSTPGNYRPVSLTSIVCKMLETIVRDQMCKHMKDNNLFSDLQYGFMEGKSCALQLLEVMQRWLEVLDSGEAIDIVYLDFRKAFDTVPHERLLKKLECYGFTGPLLAWVRSFLTDRSQRVIINGEKSEWSSVTSGIPQGSVLGPILFVLFINDLPDMLKCCVRLFADDTKVFKNIKDLSDTEALQEDLDKASDWSDAWLLRFNASKCKVMHIGRINPGVSYNMREGGKQIPVEKVTQEKDLGVIFDPELKFRHHINSVVNKANKISGLIKRTFDYLDQETIVRLYKTLVRPHLEYANAVWNPYHKKDIDKLEGVQRRTTKLVKELKDLPYADRLRALDLPTLVYRRKRGDMIQVFKIMNGIDIIDKSLLFTPCTDSRTRGHQMKLFKPRARLTSTLNSFCYRVVDEWNSLPPWVIESKDVNAFKTNLDLVWRDRPCRFNYTNTSLTKPAMTSKPKVTNREERMNKRPKP